MSALLLTFLAISTVSGTASIGRLKMTDVVPALITSDSIPNRWLSFIINSIFDPATPPQPSDVRFFLWTRSNPLEHRELFTNSSDLLKNSTFSHKKATKVLIHGFGGNGTDQFINRTRDAYLNATDLNVIGVDWSTLATYPNYARAALCTNFVGMYLAQFLDFLILSGTPDRNIHVIGYSLGAHVAGSTGHSMRTGRLPRITGLEPASGGYERPRILRALRSLNRNDAEFVDVIHTNANVIGLGTTSPIGHADFYPNGGQWQTGCFRTTEYDSFIHCSHGRATRFFVESINRSQRFLSVRCSSIGLFSMGFCGDCKTDPDRCISMGEYTSTNASGSYYLYTNRDPPYSLD